VRVRASPATSPARSPIAVFFIRTAKYGSVAPPVPRFPPDLGLNPSGEPTPSPIPRGAFGDFRREKSGNGPALSTREHTNPTIWSQIPLSLPSLLGRLRQHPSSNRPAGCLNPAVPPPTSPHQPIFRRPACRLAIFRRRGMIRLKRIYNF
jgi:hypothetical protein